MQMLAVPKMILRCSLRNYNDIYMDAKRFTEQSFPLPGCDLATPDAPAVAGKAMYLCLMNDLYQFPL